MVFVYGTFFFVLGLGAEAGGQDTVAVVQNEEVCGSVGDEGVCDRAYGSALLQRASVLTHEAMDFSSDKVDRDLQGGKVDGETDVKGKGRRGSRDGKGKGGDKGGDKAPAPTPEYNSDGSLKCGENQIPHPDYPEFCVNSALRTVEVTCPEAPSEESSSPVYPHNVMTKTCPEAVLTTKCMTKATYASITEKVSNVFNSLDDACTASNCQQADWAGCVLRMAGHDFMDFDASTGEGGADGCTDVSHADNRGLAPCLHEGEHGYSLLAIYEDFCKDVSLADFLVISAEAVMTAAGGPDFQEQFKFGRTTTKECPDAAHHLPNPEDGCAAVKTVFLDNMGLDWRGATALMGVHTLGRARPENSGYSGWWSDPENSRIFNNDYYISLRNKGWEPMRAVCGNKDRNQWVKSGDANFGGLEEGDATQLMLDTDMCLAFHIKNGAAGENCCAWLNRCHRNADQGRADGRDDLEVIGWTWKLDENGNNISNPDGCWHYESEARAAAKTSRGNLCGDDSVADCGMRNQEGEFMGQMSSGIGNQCQKKGDIWHCASSSSLSGIAHEYVTEFAEDQKIWFDAFFDAWGIATSNGFASLQALKDAC